MLFIDKKFEDITEADLQSLVTLNDSEIKIREYKKELPESSDRSKKEFLADVSSFSNASGGFLIFGIEENQGKAIALPGIAITDIDAEIQRLEMMIQSGISPRIPGVATRGISLANGANAIVVSIPQSWLGPHMVSFQNSSRFYSRTSAGKYQLDVHELKQAFNGSEGIYNRIHEFRFERLGKILADETPVMLPSKAKVVLHYIPQQSIIKKNSFSIRDIEKDYRNLVNITEGPNAYRINLDGLVSLLCLKNETTASYTQLFRDGSIEAVDGYLLMDNEFEKKTIPINHLESCIIRSSESILSFLKSHGIETPIITFLSIIGVKGYSFAFSQQMKDKLFFSEFRGIKDKIDRNDLIIPAVEIDSFAEVNMAKTYRSAFDVIWNACGFPFSLSYDENGIWHKE